MGPLRILSAAVVLALAVVTSFVTSTCVASRAYLERGAQQDRQARTLQVTGSAKKGIVSDLALWNIRVAGEGKTLEEAYRKVDEATGKARAFLSERAFSAEAVKIGPIRTEIHHARDAKGNETRDVSSYRLLRTIEIRTGDVAKVQKASSEVTELLKGGVHVESLCPEYVFTGLAGPKIEMIAEATANARLRADRIAQGSGCRVSTVKEARAGVLQITRPWSTEVSSGGMNDTSSVEKDVTSVVHLTLAIEPR
jgi:hypothetical protein